MGKEKSRIQKKKLKIESQAIRCTKQCKEGTEKFWTKRNPKYSDVDTSIDNSPSKLVSSFKHMLPRTKTPTKKSQKNESQISATVVCNYSGCSSRINGEDNHTGTAIGSLEEYEKIKEQSNLSSIIGEDGKFQGEDEVKKQLDEYMGGDNNFGSLISVNDYTNNQVRTSNENKMYTYFSRKRNSSDRQEARVR